MPTERTPHHRHPFVVGRPGPGRDHQHLVVRLDELVDDMTNGVGHTVDLRQEGLRHDGDAHASNVRAPDERRATYAEGSREDAAAGGPPVVEQRRRPGA